VIKSLKEDYIILSKTIPLILSSLIFNKNDK